MTPDPQQTVVDPFGERSRGQHKRELQLLGGRFVFRSDSPDLLALVDTAYRGLPAHRLSQGDTEFEIELRLTEGPSFAGLQSPPEPRMQGGAGFVCALMDAFNLAIAYPEARRGLVAISREMLRCFPYHARYELIEFLVFTLASRAQGLVPLHAGCVGLQGRGALLVGESGAGKSTLSLHCMLHGGLDFLTEDASFVAPQDLSVRGVGNFLHLRFDSLKFLDDEEMRAIASASPVIRRRSGVEKYELDLRQPWARLAPAPLKLEHIVMVSSDSAASGPLLMPLGTGDLLARFTRSQPYAAQQPGWSQFVGQISSLHGHRLRRGSHPREAAEALRGLLLSVGAA